MAEEKISEGIQEAIEQFLAKCKRITGDDTEVLQLIRKRIDKAKPSYINSNDFVKSLSKTLKSIKNDSANKYIHIKDFLSELKAYGIKGKRKRNNYTESDDTDSSLPDTCKRQKLESGSKKLLHSESDASALKERERKGKESIQLHESSKHLSPHVKKNPDSQVTNISCGVSTPPHRHCSKANSDDTESSFSDIRKKQLKIDLEKLPESLIKNFSHSVKKICHSTPKKKVKGDDADIILSPDHTKKLTVNLKKLPDSVIGDLSCGSKSYSSPKKKEVKAGDTGSKVSPDKTKELTVDLVKLPESVVNGSKIYHSTPKKKEIKDGDIDGNLSLVPKETLTVDLVKLPDSAVKELSNSSKNNDSCTTHKDAEDEDTRRSSEGMDKKKIPFDSEKLPESENEELDNSPVEENESEEDDTDSTLPEVPKMGKLKPSPSSGSVNSLKDLTTEVDEITSIPESVLSEHEEESKDVSFDKADKSPLDIEMNCNLSDNEEGSLPSASELVQSCSEVCDLDMEEDNNRKTPIVPSQNGGDTNESAPSCSDDKESIEKSKQCDVVISETKCKIATTVQSDSDISCAIDIDEDTPVVSAENATDRNKCEPSCSDHKKSIEKHAVTSQSKHSDPTNVESAREKSCDEATNKIGPACLKDKEELKHVNNSESTNKNTAKVESDSEELCVLDSGDNSRDIPMVSAENVEDRNEIEPSCSDCKISLEKPKDTLEFKHKNPATVESDSERSCDENDRETPMVLAEYDETTNESEPSCSDYKKDTEETELYPEGNSPHRSENEEKQRHKKGKGSERQVRRLERLLEDISDKIQSLQEKELTLDDLDDENSAYAMEEKYEKKFIQVWKKLCEIKKRAPSTGRVSERKFKFEDSRYPEVNRMIEKFVNKHGVFPDFHDIKTIICKCNVKYGLHLGKSAIENFAKVTFTSVGTQLQARRLEDFKENFGSHLTDNVRSHRDPANFDKELRRKLETNKGISKSNLDKVINKFADKQENEGDGTDSGGEEEEEEQQEDQNVDTGLLGHVNESLRELSPPRSDNAEEDSELEILSDANEQKENLGEENDKEESESGTNVENCEEESSSDERNVNTGAGSDIEILSEENEQKENKSDTDAEKNGEETSSDESVSGVSHKELTSKVSIETTDGKHVDETDAIVEGKEPKNLSQKNSPTLETTAKKKSDVEPRSKSSPEKVVSKTHRNGEKNDLHTKTTHTSGSSNKEINDTTVDSGLSDVVILDDPSSDGVKDGDNSSEEDNKVQQQSLCESEESADTSKSKLNSTFKSVSNDRVRHTVGISSIQNILDKATHFKNRANKVNYDSPNKSIREGKVSKDGDTGLVLVEKDLDILSHKNSEKVGKSPCDTKNVKKGNPQLHSQSERHRSSPRPRLPQGDQEPIVIQVSPRKETPVYIDMDVSDDEEKRKKNEKSQAAVRHEKSQAAVRHQKMSNNHTRASRSDQSTYTKPRNRPITTKPVAKHPNPEKLRIAMSPSMEETAKVAKLIAQKFCKKKPDEIIDLSSQNKIHRKKTHDDMSLKIETVTSLASSSQEEERKRLWSDSSSRSNKKLKLKRNSTTAKEKFRESKDNSVIILSDSE